MPKHGRNNTRPRAYLDCETDPFKIDRIPEPFIWGLYRPDTDEYWEFSTAVETCDFLRDKEWCVYAHNGGRFDYHYLRGEINSDDSIMVINGRLARFKIGSCEFRDSMNLIPVALKKFGNKMDIDYALLEKGVRERPENMRLIKLYLHADCTGLAAACEEYFKTYGIALTQASSSMAYWRDHFSRPKLGLELPHQTEAQYSKLKPFYYGGRVQCFASGHARQRFRVVDKNSAYPHAMTFKHPYSTDCEVSDHLPPVGDMGPTLIRLRAIARGCFPLRGEDGGLYFPYDEKTVREYFITGWELEAALETDTVKIVQVREVYTFRQCVDFGEYVAHFYDLRKRAKAAQDVAQDIFGKLYMNSLYGKFAANPDKYREYILASDDSVEKWVAEGYEVGQPWDERYLLTRAIPEKRRRHYNVATASSITGFVRADLWRSLMKCEGALYCDTDSIAARDVSRLDLGEELGQWKVEMECDEYAIAGKKTYAFKERGTDQWKMASKGVSLKAEQIVDVATGKGITYAPEVPTYTIHKGRPEFVKREIRRTYKDISRYPEGLAVSPAET